MVKSQDLQAFVKLGREQEKKFDWIAAVEPYKRALATALRGKINSKAVKIMERIGLCYHRAAMQASNSSEFRRRMHQSVNWYKKAAKLLEKSTGPDKQARICHCNAVAAYVEAWLTKDFVSRKKLLDECWKLEKKALRIYMDIDDTVPLAKTCIELNMCLTDRLSLEWNKKARQRILREALGYGDKAIGILSGLGEHNELARAYYTASIHYAIAAKGLELDKRGKYEEKALSYSEKALELSERLGDPFLLGMSSIYLGSAIIDFTDHPDTSGKHLRIALECGLHIRDNFLVGRASYLLAFLMGWKTVTEEDPETIAEASKKCEKYAEDAIHSFESISLDREIASSYYWLAENYISLTRSEGSWKSKSRLLKKSVEVGKRGLKSARRSGSIDATWFILHPLSKSLFLLSTLEKNVREKMHLLADSLQYREENIKALKQAMPYFFWNHGTYHNYLALVQAGLAATYRDRRRKVRLLKDAVESEENCIKYCLQSRNLSRGQYATLGKYHFDFGVILNQLLLLTSTPELLDKLLEVLRGAVQTFDKADLPSRVAEGYWQLAEVYDKLRNYERSTESFELAHENYITAAEKIPSLREFYQEHASYMKGWSEIERARENHTKQEYGEAKKHYERAASLHQSSKSWSYLVANYLAWAQLENGEGLSRGEQTEEAREAFHKAAILFTEAKNFINIRLEKIEATEEKEMAAELVKASATRREYCLGRVALEEAKILDRKGEHAASSDRYNTAAERFQKAIDKMEYERDRQELEPIACLCRAWQMMTRAEAEASPNLYLQASKLFEEAKERSFDQKAKLLALGHSAFCKALEAGRKFEASRETRFHSAATQHLEGAANYYVRAGFTDASEYAKATQRLFDAHLYSHKAKTELNPIRKAQYYQMSEKLLQASAASYTSAKKPEKSQNAMKLLESVKEERELALSLAESFHPPKIMSTTASFSTPTPTFEKAVGLERFEGAKVHASLVLSAEEKRVGEHFDLQILLANVGKEAVLLTKVENIFPETFKLVAKPDHCHRKNLDLNMDRRRLDPLKTEQINLVLSSFEKGSYRIQPRINGIDETGHQFHFAPEPIDLYVSELTLPNRVATGFTHLDSLLFGGIPENYAVLLTTLSCDERDKLIRSFLECGVMKGQVTFLLTASARGVETLAEACQSSFYIFICNPQTDALMKGLPNLFTLKGVENLTDISIALTSNFRRLGESPSGPRRACIEIISDVLLQHGAVQTRRWLNALIPEFKSRGFITLGVLNPQMHPSQEVQAILDLFDGEISITEKEAEGGVGKFLKIKKLYNQRYSDMELPLKGRS